MRMARYSTSMMTPVVPIEEMAFLKVGTSFHSDLQ
jgi:hypothetical protein